MKRRIQFGKWLLAAASFALLSLPCAAQKREANRPPQQQRQQQPKAQKQERRQQQENRKGQNNRPNNDRPRNNAAPNREPQNRQPESMGMIGGNRPPNARNDSNRPPNATSSQPRRLQDMSQAEKQRVLQNNEKYNRMSPQKQQEIQDAYRNWKKLTPEQQSHVRNDLAPKWQQMPPQRQKAIRQRLGVLQNMPESARNQHLNDPNFTRGMSEEDKDMLRDLSHMHVGAPDAPHE